jgi:hypothetical protein
MSAVSYIEDTGVHVSVVGDSLKLSGLSKLAEEQKSQVINFAQKHKPAIIAALTQNGIPGQCELCPAAGYWEYGEYTRQGLMCFHYAYFLHKAGRPTPCSVTRANCPREVTGDNR